MKRPFTTLFLLASVDGKISTGASDALDFDRDLPKIKGVREGLHQYYDLEQNTDLYSLNTGRVMEKMGVNRRKDKPAKLPVSFVIIDLQPHLTRRGVAYLAAKTKKLFIVTTDKDHPANKVAAKNVEIIRYSRKVDLPDLLARLTRKYRIKRLTIQSGGTLNAAFIRAGLVDRLSLVVAPVIVGGKDTTTIMDGESLRSVRDLKNVKAIKLKKIRRLRNSYLHIVYDVR